MFIVFLTTLLKVRDVEYMGLHSAIFNTPMTKEAEFVLVKLKFCLVILIFIGVTNNINNGCTVFNSPCTITGPCNQSS